MSHGPAVNCYVGKLVNRVPLCDQLFEHRFGIFHQQRPVVAAFHPLQKQRQVAPQPHRNTACPHQGAGVGIHERPAAGGDNPQTRFEQPGDDPALAIAKIGLAMLGKNVSNRHAGGAFDFLVSVKKRQPQGRGQPAPNGGLAGAHQPNQHHSALVECRANLFHIFLQPGGMRQIGLVCLGGGHHLW